MKKLMDVLIVLCLFCAAVLGQNVNPQQNFAAEEQMANPSLLLNFNDATTSFRDNVSGLSFGNIGPAPVPPGSSNTSVGYFNGTNDDIATGSTSALDPAAISTCAWIKLAALPTSGEGYYEAITSNPSYQIFIASTGKLAVYLTASGAGVSYDATGSHTLALKTWNFVCATYSATSGLTGYVNGVVDKTVAANGTLAAATGVTYIGLQSNHFFNGQISGVTYYNVALTQTQIQGLQTGSTYAGLLANWQLNEGSGTTAIDSSGNGYTGTWAGTQGGNSGYYLGPTVSGAVTTQQPGFDNTNLSNYSAAFPYNGFSVAPNNTLGAIDWMNPWTMLVHIDRLNWNRTGTLVLASKGDSSSANNNWWRLVLNGPGNAPGPSQLCFSRSGVNVTGAPFMSTGDTTCTNYDVANGYNYDVVVTNNGTGAAGSAGCSSCTASIVLYVNGLGNGYAPTYTTTQSYNIGFGAVGETIVSGGTGYANSTAFTATGGGPNCNVTGTATATSGVITSVSNGNDFGCTSVPTIVLTSPTGTGASFTVHLAGASMNSTALPLMVPGAVNAGAYTGIDQTDSTQTATNVDEFAIFPGVLTASQIQTLFYLTKVYQGILPTVPQHIPVIVNEILCADYDATTTISVVIRLHQLGYINLLGVAMELDGGEGAATFRQELDQAGLANVPLAMASNSNTFGAGDTGVCHAANLTAYNASTPQSYLGYPTTASMYRKIFAANPTTPITLLTPTLLFGTYDFMTSAADSISPLTGAQLWARNVANGAAMYLEGGPTCGYGPGSAALPATTPCNNNTTGDNTIYFGAQGQYVIANLAGMPTYLMGGSPASNGPGVLVTRTSNDPLYLASATYGNDGRTAWDSLGTMMMLTPIFQGGVQIGYSGGTGYTNETAFTSTGGGANCHVEGYMSALGGVPNGIHPKWGNYSRLDIFNTYGYGCTSAPTIHLVSPTGTGVTLTAYPSTVCGTDTVTNSGSVYTDAFDSTTCSSQYSVIYTDITAPPGSGGGPSPVYQWVLNSLENPVPVGQARAQ